MATYSISAPDGNTYQVSGPDGATDDQVRSEVLRQNPGAGKPATNIGPPLAPASDADVRSAAKSRGDSMEGVANLVLSNLLSLPHGAAHGALDFGRMLTGQNQDAPEPSWMTHGPLAQVSPSPTGVQAAQDIENSTPIRAYHNADQAVTGAINGISPALGHGIQTGGRALNDILSFLPVAGLAGGLAKAAQAGMAARAASTTATSGPIAAGDIDTALKAVGYPSLPSKTAGASGLAETGESIAGAPAISGQQSLTSQAVTNALGKSEAGLAPHQVMTPETLAAARASGPGQVYNAAHDSLPSHMTQDGTLMSALATIGDTTSQLPKSPDVAALKSFMISQPEVSNDQVFSNIQQARENASRYHGPNATPDQEALGDAYQGIANAYEDFVGRQLSANPASPVSLHDWQNARVQFAKNYAVQNALGGADPLQENSLGLNASKIAALQKKNPGQLTGGLQLIAEQHNRYPLSTGYGPTTMPPEGVGASGSTPGIIARHVTGPLVGGGIGLALGGPSGAAIGSGAGMLGSEALQGVLWRVLGGNPEAARALAEGAATNPQLSNFFGPRGNGGSPFTPDSGLSLADDLGAGGHATSAGQGIPLADLLSHGVEQRPPEGFTAGPMGHPELEGIPFQINAEHAAGDLETEEPSLADLLEDLRDHPDVMSQGVPEGTVQHIAPKMALGPDDFVTNNGSLNSGGASQESINAGTKPLIEFGQDDVARPLLRDVGQRDLNPRPNAIIIDRSTGQMVNSGNMAPRLARGLLERWKMLHQPLGEHLGE